MQKAYLHKDGGAIVQAPLQTVHVEYLAFHVRLVEDSRQVPHFQPR